MREDPLDHRRFDDGRNDLQLAAAVWGVLDYHFVRTLRLRLKQHGITDSWITLRQALATQHRVSVTLQRRDGRTVHVRKATRPKPRHQTLATILKLDPNPGRTHRVLV